MKILIKKYFSLSMSSAKPLGWWRGRGGPRTAPPRGQKPVNNFNIFFLDAIWCKPADLRHLADKKSFFFSNKYNKYKVCLFN